AEPALTSVSAAGGPPSKRAPKTGGLPPPRRPPVFFRRMAAGEGFPFHPRPPPPHPHRLPPHSSCASGGGEWCRGTPLSTPAGPCRSWADRLRLNGGIEREGRRVHPRSNWRPPTTRELSLLVRQDPGRESPLTRVPVSENPESAGLPHHEEICLKPWEAGLVA